MTELEAEEANIVEGPVRDGVEALCGETSALVLCRHPVVGPAGLVLPLNVAETDVTDRFTVDGDGEVSHVGTVWEEQAVDEVTAGGKSPEIRAAQLVVQAGRRRRGGLEGSSIVWMPRPQVNRHGWMVAH